MKRISVLILGFFVAGSAYSWVSHSDLPYQNASNAVIDLSKIGESYQDGVNIRKAREEKKAHKKHLKAMKELEQLDLADKQAIMSFAKSYPEEVDRLKVVLELQQQLQ